MALCEIGTFSYIHDNVNFISIDQHLSIRIARISNDVARVFLVDAQGVQQKVPSYVTMRNGQGAPVPPFEDEFFTSWTDSYTLYVKGAAHLALNPMQQQAISAPPGVANGIV